MKRRQVGQFYSDEFVTRWVTFKPTLTTSDQPAVEAHGYTTSGHIFEPDEVSGSECVVSPAHWLEARGRDFALERI